MSRNRIVSELNGVRGIAVLMVLLLHFGERPSGVPRIFTAPFSLGWSGVDLFFVLSGFLITGILLDTRQSTNYFSSFYARRILRIFPIYFLAVFGYFHVLLPIAHRYGLLRLYTDSREIWYLCYLSNWLAAFRSNPGVTLLGHFWSLAIEEQYYLVWPVVIFAAKRSWLPNICLATIGLSFGLRCAFQNHHPAYHFLYTLTPFRLEPLAFGGLVAIIVRDEKWCDRARNHFGVVAFGALLVLSGVLVLTRDAHPETPLMTTLGFSAFAIIYSCLVFFAYTNAGSSGWLAVQLRRPFLVSFGLYSYGIYVFHAPIAFVQNTALLTIAERIPAHFHILLWAASKVFGVALSYGIAMLSWHLVEKHFLRLKSRFSAQRRPEAP
jgi:peptidoglycan/LPS O-acetylase OafA/YrhL